MIGQWVSEGLLRQAPASERRGARYVERARAFIETRLAERVSMRQAARHVNLCPAYFCRLFKRESGQTFSSYLARARVERAQRLLQVSAKSITEIGYAAGFQSLWHFNDGFSPNSISAGIIRQIDQAFIAQGVSLVVYVGDTVWTRAASSTSTPARSWRRTSTTRASAFTWSAGTTRTAGTGQRDPDRKSTGSFLKISMGGIMSPRPTATFP
jgi:AraC-like DNA-binding protein